MANLQIKGMDDDLYRQIKELAESENRSISQEVIFLIKTYLANRQAFSAIKSPAKTLLDLSGSWEDKRQADEIITEIRKARTNSRKLREGF